MSDGDHGAFAEEAKAPPAEDRQVVGPVTRAENAERYIRELERAAARLAHAAGPFAEYRQTIKRGDWQAVKAASDQLWAILANGPPE